MMLNDTALGLLIKQIHAALQANLEVALLYSLDMTGAVDRVVPVGLFHNLRKRYIPHLIIDLCSSFLSDRCHEST